MGVSVGVLGGGALGLSAALRLARYGCRVTVLEKESELGGLAVGFRLGEAYLEKFYHHLFRTDTVAVGLVRELGLDHLLEWHRPDTSVLYQGRIYSLDSALDVVRFSPLPLPDRLRMGLILAYLKYGVKDGTTFADMTADQWLRRWMGTRAYSVVWEPLLRGKFGDRYDQIIMPWFWSRVHERTSSLGYLRGGFQRLYWRMGEEIQALGGSVETGRAATSLKQAQDGAIVVSAAGREYRFDRVIVSLPTPVFARIASGLPEDYVRSYSGPEHFGAHVVIVVLDRPLTSIYWLNICDPGLPFVSLVEHTNLMPPEDYGGRHVVYLGNYLPMDHPLFTASDQDVVGQFLPHLRKINQDFRHGWVRETYVFRAPFAQPVVTAGYTSKLPPHRTPLPGVYLANMAHVFPQDRGQNYSMRLGIRVAEMLLADLQVDSPWRGERGPAD